MRRLLTIIVVVAVTVAGYLWATDAAGPVKVLGCQWENATATGPDQHDCTP